MNASSLLSFSQIRGAAVFSLEGSISRAECLTLGEEIRRHLRTTPSPQVILRMEGVTSIDSSGLGLFLSLQDEFKATRFRFTGLRSAVRLVFELSRHLEHFILDDTWEQSQESVAPVLVADPSPKEFLSIEGKYILTDEGVRYCTQRPIPTKDLRLYRGSMVSGFGWSSVNTDLLERFVVHGLIGGVELERTEFLNKREDILRLTAVLFDGLFLKRFPSFLQRRFRDRGAYRPWKEGGLSLSQIRAALRNDARRVAHLRIGIEEAFLLTCPEMSASKAARLVGRVDDAVWFLLLSSGPTTGNPELRELLLETLTDYSRRLDLSEAIALNLMEFLQQAEKAHFWNLAERDPFTRKNPQSIPILLADPRFRERLISKAQLQNELLVMNMDFSRSAPASDQVVEITVRNKGTSGNAGRTEALSESPSRSADWGEDPLEAALADLEGGLMNLAALKRLCGDQGISLETRLERDERLDETVAKMRLAF